MVAEEVNVVVQVATPAVMVAVPQPEIVVPPETKFTVPVGVTPGPETVAVRTVLVPTVVGEGLAEREVVVVPTFTVSVAVPVDPV